MSHITIEVGEFKVTLPFDTLVRLAKKQIEKQVVASVTYKGPLDFLMQKTEDLDPALFGLEAVRIVNCFRNNDIIYLGDLVQKTDRELLAMGNFGRKSLRATVQMLAFLGLSLGMTVPDWSLAKEELAASTAVADTRPVQYYNGGYDPDNIKPRQPRRHMEHTS